MSDKIIAVFGATGQQGGGVVDALLKKGGYAVRAITRDVHSEKAKALAGRGVEVVAADLNYPGTLGPALLGAHGVFLVTNFWDPATSVDEHAQAARAVMAAKAAGITHFVWSTLPDVAGISGGKYDVPHFTNKARANDLIRNAGFPHYSFVEAPSFFQNFLDGMGPQPTGEGDQKAWTVPMDPNRRAVHAGDINDLGVLVAEVFDHAEFVGAGQMLSLAADCYSWQELADILNAQGHNVVVKQVPGVVYDTFFDGAAEIRQMMEYFQEYTYFGPAAEANRERANALMGDRITGFADWAAANMPA